MRLDGKVAVISGIGAATARAFTREGARVVIADIDDTAGDAVAAEIRDRGGVIDFLHADASVSGLSGDYGLGACNVLKAGVVNLSRVTGTEYARKGIRCNAVCPGTIGTPPIDRLYDAAPQIWEDIRDAIPMGRYGRAEEIANVVLFLAYDEAAFVTGTHVVADGGLWAHSGMPPIGGLGPDF
jgi:NAD(P)-dependent dehydrogenase (short-subunit alcohol dehydrogenase family)